jgi:hypothetical protein
MLTEQHPEATLETILRPMQSMVANETTICCKEQISVGTSQTRQHVKSYAVNGREDRRGEMGLREELEPMSIVIVRHHGLL